MENLLADRKDLKRERLERTRDLMNRSVLGCLIEGYEALIPSLSLPDPDDRHVLAAAMHGAAEIIVTFNLKHFPHDILQPHGIEAQHPDEFVSQLFDLDPGAVCRAVRDQRLSLKKPPKTVEQFLSVPAFTSLPKTLKRLRTVADHI